MVCAPRDPPRNARRPRTNPQGAVNRDRGARRQTDATFTRYTWAVEAGDGIATAGHQPGAGVAQEARQGDVDGWGLGEAMMNVLDLFSGSGGFSLGLERAGGFSTVAFCEIEPAACRVLKRHWPEVPCYDDIKTLTASRLASDGIFPDCIVGGFPCTDVSVAGKGAGLGGTQSGLWFEFLRLIGEIRPQYVIVENVAALLRRGIGDVLGGLAKIGFDAEWDCLPATFVGAPHNRDRLWLIAYPQRDQQSRQESCFGAIRRMGWVEQPVPWDRDWQDALRALRGMDDGVSRSVERTDMMRNAVVPQLVELIGRAIMTHATLTATQTVCA